MGDFQGFLQRKEDLRHSYDKFRFCLLYTSPIRSLPITILKTALTISWTIKRWKKRRPQRRAMLPVRWRKMVLPMTALPSMTPKHTSASASMAITRTKKHLSLIHIWHLRHQQVRHLKAILHPVSDLHAVRSFHGVFRVVLCGCLLYTSHKA